jgi:hypothetical protein
MSNRGKVKQSGETYIKVKVNIQYPSNSSHREYNMAIWFVYNTVLIVNTLTITGQQTYYCDFVNY